MTGRIHRWRMATVAAIVVCLAQGFLAVSPAMAIAPDDAFDAVWRTTDASVAAGTAGYSWFWGPEPRLERTELYEQSLGGTREVRYYDKSRMEITHPNGDPSSIWYVTNGLLTVELVTGRHQIGDDSFEQRGAATAQVAGDQENNPGTPSYAEFAGYVTTDGKTNREPDRTGQAATDSLSGEGVLGTSDSRGVTLASYQQATGHNIASVFWAWANDPSSGLRPDQGVDWLYVLGYPISEPYWIDATVAGTTRPVLVQLFQRRVLTYDGSNPAAYRVEFGNIGLHYRDWLMPQDGAELYGWDLADWPDQEFSSGNAFAQGGTYHHHVEPWDGSDNAAAVFSYLPDRDLRDLSASIRTRLLTPDAEVSEACLMIRLPQDLLHDFAFCINGAGETSAIYEDTSGDDPIVDYLLDYDVRAGTKPPGEWNELKIVAQGNHFWFLINGTLAGDAEYAGPAGGGTIGFYLINFDDVPVEYEWDGLSIHALE